MQSSSTDDKPQIWADIQKNTFTNWINEQLHRRAILDLSEDLSDGVLLIRLVETLQGRRYFGKVYEDNPTEIQRLMNVQMALDALREDGVKTVNIGNHDIVEGNTKLILGLIWCLVQRYQIACRTKIPPKKLVMAWIQSVLPDLKLTNFRTNWNDGKALSALLEYCQPGLCPEWMNMNSRDATDNCARALELAEKYLGIPQIISPEHLSSSHLDELSCLTYLSYFITRDGPGYRATLQRAQLMIPECDVQDFDLSWTDGYLLACLIEAVGGQVPDFEHMKFDSYKDFVDNISMCLDSALELGVGSLIGADDLADPQGEHLGTMALVAALISIGPKPQFSVTQCFTNQQVNLDLAFAEGSEVRVDELDVQVIGPTGRSLSNDTIKLRKSRTANGAVLSLVPGDTGFHQVRIYCQGSELPSSPISLRVLSTEESRAASVASRAASQNRIRSSATVERQDSDVDISHKSFAQRRLHIIKQLEAQNSQIIKDQQPPPIPNTKEWQKRVTSPTQLEATAHQEMPLSRTDVGLVSFSGLSEPCSVGSIVEVVINAHGEHSTGEVYVDAVAPSGRVISCDVTRRYNSFMATFTPTEVGLWRIGILYEGEHIRGSPFACQVFDASLVDVYGLDVGLVGQELRFTANASQAGSGQLQVSVLRHGREIGCSVEEQGKSRVYRINFIPDGAGQYKIHVLFNRMEVKGSPFILDIADASSVSVYGENLRIASVGKEAAFMVHASGADSKDIAVIVTGPTGKVQHGKVFVIDDVTYRVVWTPTDAGEHNVDVRLFDQSVYDSPFVCNVGAPELVSVKNMPRRIQTKDLYTDQSFEIDASTAGSGNLEIMINGGRVPCRVKELGSRQYMAIFTPTQSITHTVEMRFNGEEISGSPWKIPVEDKSERRQDMERTKSYYSELSGPGLVRAPINNVASFDVAGEGLELQDIQAKIYGPDGREFPIRIIPRGPGKYTAEYEIEQVGEHQLTVWIAGRKVDGSPLSVAGYAAQKVKIEPLGGGAVGIPVQFVVDAVEAGKGQLEISVNQGRVPNNVQMQGAGRCLVTFIPQHAGTYVIDVTFNGEKVHGCPIRVDILPKQIGQQVQANLTPTAVSTAISAGGTTNISSQLRESRSPTSPTSPSMLRHHTRQRSEESSNPKSTSILKDIRGRSEEPWKSSYAPSSTSTTRVSSSLSPQRDWTATSVYDKIYGNNASRTLSPSDPSRTRIVSETTTTTTTTTLQRTPSPNMGGVRSREFAERLQRSPSPQRREVSGRTPSPILAGLRSREFVDRRQDRKTPSPTRQEIRYASPFTNRTIDAADYRSPSPLRDEVRSRISEAASPYGRTPSPSVSERVRRIEAIDPLAEEERRERARNEPDAERASSQVGYTVAQYGETTPKLHSDTLRKPSPGIVEKISSTDRVEFVNRPRDASPRAMSPPRDLDIDRFRAATPPTDYDTRPSSRTFKKYEPQYIERTTYSSQLPPREHEYDEVDRGYSEIKPFKPSTTTTTTTTTTEQPVKEEKPFSASASVYGIQQKEKEPTFLRTQSEIVETDVPETPTLHRTEEKESIYDMPPPTTTTVEDEELRDKELARVQAEDKKILSKHGFVRKAIHDVSTEIDEPLQDIHDVIELADGKTATESSHALQSLEPAGELPHSPPISAPTTPSTTPKLSAKFKKDAKEGKTFDFGKSKFTAKHDVVKRGKDVEVKLDSLKLGKEDVLRVVVMAPIRASEGQTEPHEVETKVKKSGSKYEIGFKANDVGTHKVYAYVNEVQHPLSPFAVRVYDASEIIVGEIPSQAHLNDTVEFTVDAGRAGFGNLEMAIKDSDGVIIPSHVTQLETGSAKFLVTFTPATKGAYTVNITFNKEVLKNSPFEVQIIDPVASAVETPEIAASPVLTKKELKKEKEERKREEKERAKREKEEKAATLKAKKKGRSISKTAVTRIPSLSRVGQPCSINVEVAGGDQLLVTVSDAKKREIGTEITELEPGVMQINFVPEEVGDHEIVVKYGGQSVTGSPFTCRAYDPAQIKVGTIPKGLVDKPVYFTVDASEAGVGNLEVAVNDGRVPSMAHALGQHKYDISFVPKDNETHTISVRFNNEPVPGSPFVCHLLSSAQTTASGPGLERIAVDEETEILLQTSEPLDNLPEVRIRDAQANDVEAKVTRSKKDKNTIVVTYAPKCVGNHQVDILLDGEPIAGSPYTAKAYDARKAILTPCEKAVVGKPTTFTIDAARAGAGNMEIIVSVDNRNVPNFVQAEGQARFKVSFTPQEAREHVISVKFNGISVPGSPMTCNVEPMSNGASTLATAALTGAAAGVASAAAVPAVQKRVEHKEKFGLAKELQNAQIGQKKGFTVENTGKAKDCNVIIIDPKGGPLPVRCYKQQDDSYWVEFTPEQTGTHTIEVTFGDVEIAGSPFHCEVIDPKRVAVKGLSESLVLRHATTINVDRSQAGTGDLQVEITDPNGSPLKVEMLKSPGGEDRVTFLPNRLGPHKVNVRMAGFQIPGYPQTIVVAEQEQPGVYGAAIDQSIKINEPASLIFDPKKQNGGLKINVQGPQKTKIHHNVMRRPNGTSEVVFYPEEVGIHNVSIDFNNKPLKGSPYTVRVVDPSKVIVNDLDMDRDGSLLLRLGHNNMFDVDATAAGPGKLRAEVRDADSSLLRDGPEVDDLGYGKYRVSFNPKEPGRYSIYLYWNELPVESAYPVRARSAGEEMPSTSKHRLETITTTTSATTSHVHPREKSTSSAPEDEISRVMMRGDGLHKAILKEQNEFIIDGSDNNREGRITATLLGQKADVPVRVQQLGHNVYKAYYTPLTGGIYELHVLWNGKHVNGSPFKVTVDSSTSPADLITVDPSTLKIGIIGDEIKTLIDTRRSGPGQLSAQCMGPLKLAYCELYDHRDGTYTLNIRPAEVGKHTLTIKYNDVHVRGSPFLIHVSNPPDPSKVRVYGPGIEHGILSLFKSNFVVETRGAGAGQLTVRVRGPKGAFNVEMQREKKNERTIHCKYEPKEPGDYQVEVKWHGEHVPGSPFLVMIVDTETELTRFLRGEAPSPSPATPFVPPGWVGPPPPMFHGGMGGPPSRGPYGPPMGPYGPPQMMPFAGPPPPRHKGKYH